MPAQPVIPILEIRSQKVVLDADLAALYEVSTSAFNQAVKRNIHRFPADFSFVLNAREFASLRSQTVISGGSGGRRYLPRVFTEHGALMAASVLNSERAVEMSIFVIRAFVKMREALAANAAILKRLAEIDKTLLLHDKALRDVYQKLLPLLQPPPPSPRKSMGFQP
jgi:hypothetical protein